MRELRHDFRAFYHVAYDEVGNDEAIDLVATLPAGSLYRASLGYEGEWGEEQYFRAEVVDMLHAINWRLANCPEDMTPVRLPRPGDAAREAAERAEREAKKSRVRASASMARSGKWKEV